MLARRRPRRSGGFLAMMLCACEMTAKRIVAGDMYGITVGTVKRR